MRRCPSCGEENQAGAERCQRCGGDLSPAPGQPGDALKDRVRSLLQQGQKIEAIRVYREATGAGLLQAKKAVEALASGGVPAGPATDFEQELLALLRGGQKIQAIKLFREETGVGLKEAKDLVEELARRHGIPAGTSCGAAIALLLVGATLAAVASVGLLR